MENELDLEHYKKQEKKFRDLYQSLVKKSADEIYFLTELIKKYASYMKTANYHQMSDEMLSDLNKIHPGPEPVTKDEK